MYDLIVYRVAVLPHRWKIDAHQTPFDRKKHFGDQAVANASGASPPKSCDTNLGGWRS
jgi:hypothetical protein